MLSTLSRFTIAVMMLMAFFVTPAEARRGGFLSTTGSFQLSSCGGPRGYDAGRL